MKYSGVYIAPVTPLDSSDQIDFKRFEELIEYLLRGGVDGVCVGGGTSEYPRLSLKQRKQLISHASRQIGDRATVFGCIGTASFSGVLELGEHAARENVDAVLLTMPHFYLYRQSDLELFCREVSRRLRLPCLLYNLPDFTNPLEPETAIRLLQTEPGLIGIKDSGGDSAVFKQFVEAFLEKEVSLIVGRDALIHTALDAGWDGIVSGLGNLCPELLACLLDSFRIRDRKRSQACQIEINRISDFLQQMPVPWAIRGGLEVRGLPCGPPALPLTGERSDQMKNFQLWFSEWLENDLPRVVGGKVFNKSSASLSRKPF